MRFLSYSLHLSLDLILFSSVALSTRLGVNLFIFDVGHVGKHSHSKDSHQSAMLLLLLLRLSILRMLLLLLLRLLMLRLLLLRRLPMIVMV